MHPINKEFLTVGDLRRQADSLEKSASGFLKRGMLDTFKDLRDRAGAKRRHAQRLVDAQDLRASADLLEASRSVRTATTADPYGEGVHA